MGDDTHIRAYREDREKINRIKKKLELEKDTEVRQKDVVHGVLQEDEDTIVEELKQDEDRIGSSFDSLF